MSFLNQISRQLINEDFPEDIQDKMFYLLLKEKHPPQRLLQDISWLYPGFISYRMQPTVGEHIKPIYPLTNLKSVKSTPSPNKIYFPLNSIEIINKIRTDIQDVKIFKEDGSLHREELTDKVMINDILNRQYKRHISGNTWDERAWTKDLFNFACYSHPGLIIELNNYNLWIDHISIIIECGNLSYC